MLLNIIYVSLKLARFVNAIVISNFFFSSCDHSCYTRWIYFRCIYNDDTFIYCMYVQLTQKDRQRISLEDLIFRLLQSTSTRRLGIRLLQPTVHFKDKVSNFLYNDMQHPLKVPILSLRTKIEKIMNFNLRLWFIQLVDFIFITL